LENGLLLSEANQGDLQSYIDGPSEIDTATRVKWCIQVAEAMAYVHDKGIVHSNLSMQNVLVHQRTPGQPPDILLADFGGSKCTELGVNGHLLPDDPFMDHTLPRDGPFDSPNIDVYSLGMLFYVIDTGHLPFHEGPAPEGRDWWAYEDRLRELSAEGIFPDLEGVRFRRVIEGCCCERRFGNGKEVLKALRRGPGAVGVGGDGVVEVG
jgi:serine/threonine protein kinase